MSDRDPAPLPAAVDGDASDPAVSMMAVDRASRDLGIEVAEIRRGYARLRLRVTPRHLNGHHIVHGGLLFTLADTAFACACNSGRTTTVAAGADIDFIAAAHEGDLLEAEAIERASFGRSGITDVTVRRVEPDTALVAEFRGRSRTTRAPD